MKEKRGIIQTLLGLALAIFLGTSLLVAGGNPLKVSTVQENLYLITGMQWDINVTCLVTGDGVLVVDSGNDPAEGRWLVEKIKEKTDKPIKYVVLTHHHFDHSLGLLGFPKDVTIIAHSNCAQNISKFGETQFKWFLETVLPGQIEESRKKIVKLKKENSPELEKEEKELKKLTQQMEDLKEEKLIYPGITFDKKLTLTMGKEKIEIIYPGPAHTNGDSLVYIPGRKVIIMGDILFYGYLPYVDWRGGSDTRHWITLMEKLSQWDIEKVVPGHGEVTDKSAFEQKKRLLVDLRKSVKEAMDKGLTLEEMNKSIKMENYKHLKFYKFLALDIEAVYQEMNNKKKD
jgi:glyoxylase-like metal-dependent hydrolase (beta-lactamase superfamily II)